MCYPCTSCGRCGKFDPNSPLYTPPPNIPCLKCGGKADPETGKCLDCGEQVILVYSNSEADEDSEASAEETAVENSADETSAETPEENSEAE